VTRAEQALPGRVDPLCWRCQRPVTIAAETTAVPVRGIPQPAHRSGDATCVPRLTPRPKEAQ
jgi:hypothetical protein